jgi:hypothetical protein
MRKHRLIQILTLLVLAAALGVSVARKTGLRFTNSQSAGQDPQATVYAMVDAARTGDVKAYLAAFTGPMEAGLRQTLAETKEAEFSTYLRGSATGIKGVAVYEPQINQGTATVRVEYVYQDRNQVQMMYLRQGSKGWKIFRTDGDERIKTLIPYGTPVK